MLTEQIKCQPKTFQLFMIALDNNLQGVVKLSGSGRKGKKTLCSARKSLFSFSLKLVSYKVLHLSIN